MSVELARWQGGVDQKLADHADELREQRRRLDNHGARIGILEVSVGKIAVKIGVASAVGSLIGGGLVTLVVILASGGPTP